MALAEGTSAHEEPTQQDDAPTATSGTMSASTANAVIPKAVTRFMRWAWAVGVMTAVVVGYLLLARSSRPAVAMAPSAAPPVVAAEPPPRTVRISFGSKPSAARLFLDDQPIEGNPALRVLPRDGIVHRVRAELPGYRTASAEVPATGDQELTFNLEEIVPEPKPAKRAPSAKGTTGATAPRVTPAPVSRAANCAQPFYVGPDGIKKIKPACL